MVHVLVSGMVWYVVWYEILFHTTPYHTSVPYHEMQCAHDIIGKLQDLLSPDKTSSEILIRLLNSPVILHLDKSITVIPLYKLYHSTITFPQSSCEILSMFFV